MDMGSRTAMINKIKAICPDSSRKVYVRDDWYPSYREAGTNRSYVNCDVICSFDSSGFYTKIIFWGADDFGLEKEFCSSNMNAVAKMYKRFRKYAKNVPQNRELKSILYRDNFQLF